MGMFGLSQEDVQQQQEADNQKQALNVAGLTNGQMTNYNGALTGQMLARGIDAGFGTKDPQIERANKLQEIQQQTEQQVPFNDSPLKHMQLAISNLQNAGLYKEAQNAFDHYKEFAGSQAQTTNADASLIKANKDGAKKLKSIQYGTDNKSYNSYDDGSSEPTTNQFVQKSGSDPAIITLQNHRNDLISQLKDDPTNNDIKQQIVEISKNIANTGQSFQYITGADGTVYAADKKTGTMTPASSTQQPTQVSQPMPQGQNSATWQGGDIAPKDMQKIQMAAQKGNMDARALLDSYNARDQSQTAQSTDNQQPMQGETPQQAPINVGAKSSLSSTAVDTAALNLLMLNKTPAGLARGYKGQTSPDMTAIINRSGELQNELGLSKEDIVLLQANNKALVPALGALQKQTQMLEGFEKGLVGNAIRAKELSSEVWRTGSPWVNKPWLSVLKNGANDTNVGLLNIRVKSTMTEFAKIMSGSMGNTALSDQAVKDAQDLINSSQSDSQLNANLDEIISEAKDTRISGMKQQTQEALQSMLPKKSGTSQSTSTQANRPPLSSFRR